jgi:8-amino-7-oxononanoate synthase
VLSPDFSLELALVIMNQHDSSLPLYWPLREAKEKDIYFYLEATESYLPDCRVNVVDHGELTMLSSCSYLNLNGHPKINKAAHDAIDRYGTGTQGVRLLAGTLDIHRALEERIARFKGTAAAVTFSSGFMANVSTITALMERNDTIICDKLDHASIVDGCLLSRAKFSRFRHNDMDHLEECLKDPENRGRKLVIVDAVFSMDGDIINLPEVSRLCRKHGAMLMVDEAHSIGVLGRTGHGIEEHFGMPPDSVDIKMGTLSKAIPSIGGYIAGSAWMCAVLAHQARGFIYSGALPAPAAAAARVAFDVIEDEPERVEALQRNIRHFSTRLGAEGFSSSDSVTAIFPIICGDDWRGWELARYCQKQGIYVQSIPHPVVPKGTARLRATVTSAHTPKILDRCVAIMGSGAREIGIIN